MTWGSKRSQGLHILWSVNFSCVYVESSMWQILSFNIFHVYDCIANSRYLRVIKAINCQVLSNSRDLYSYWKYNLFFMHSTPNTSVFSYVLIGQLSKYQKKEGERFSVANCDHVKIHRWEFYWKLLFPFPSFLTVYWNETYMGIHVLLTWSLAQGCRVCFLHLSAL